MTSINEELKIIKEKRRELFDKMLEKEAAFAKARNNFNWKEYKAASGAWIEAENSLIELLKK